MAGHWSRQPNLPEKSQRDRFFNGGFERFPVQLFKRWPEAGDQKNNPKRLDDSERRRTRRAVRPAGRRLFDFVSTWWYSTCTPISISRESSGATCGSPRRLSPEHPVASVSSRAVHRKSRSRKQNQLLSVPRYTGSYLSIYARSERSHERTWCRRAGGEPAVENIVARKERKERRKRTKDRREGRKQGKTSREQNGGEEEKEERLRG